MSEKIKIQLVPIEKLQLNEGQIKDLPKNPRFIKDERFKDLVQSIKDLPSMMEMRELIILPFKNNFVVIAGNMRLQACKELKWKKVLCKILPKSTSIKVLKEILIKDNISYGEYDSDILANEFEFDDLIDWGFDEQELIGVFDNEIIEDEPPALQEKAISKMGDLYELDSGNGIIHRVLCGDATLEKDVEKLMNSEKINLCITDPPYKMNMDGGGFLKKGMKRTNKRIEKIIDFNPINIKFLLNLEIGTFYIFCNKDLIKAYFEIFVNYIFNILFWAKTNPTPFTNETFLPDIEYILFFCNNKRIWNNNLKPTEIYKKYYISSKNIERVFNGDLHPTMKPIELLKKFILISSKKNNLILDLFLGSGSTLIACEQTGRKCFGLEISELYIDVIIRRYINYKQSKNENFTIKRNGKKISGKEFEI